MIQKQFSCHRLNQSKTDKNMFQAFWQLVILMAVKRQNGQVTAYPVQFVLDPSINGQEFTNFSQSTVIDKNGLLIQKN